MIQSLFPKGLTRIKSKFAVEVFGRLYRRMAKYYVEDHPDLEGSALANIYPTLLSHNIEILDFDKDENLVYLKKDNLYFVTTPGYPWIIREVFCQHIYFINPKLFKKDKYVVFDIGMNRGYASLYFANQGWCEEVYGFELSQDTYNIAIKNLELNTVLRKKIRTFNYGLGDKDEKLKMYYLPHRDGICTTSMEFLEGYAPEELDQIVELEGVIKKSSSVFRAITEESQIDHIILKIDVEGAEYQIFNNLIQEYPQFLDKVNIIIGEAHLGLEPLINALGPFGFKETSSRKLNPKTHDFLFVKESV